MEQNAQTTTITTSISWIRLIFLCFGVSLVTQLFLGRISDFLRDVSCRVDFLAPLCPIIYEDSSVSTQQTQTRKFLPQELQARISHIEDPLPIEPWTDQEKWGIVRSDKEEKEEKECKEPAKEQEAIAALNQARSNRNSGNHKKAGVIIEHALALLPSHPDILVEYGLHLETNDRIVEADGYCVRALHVDPQNSQAIACRARTESIVAEIDEKMLRDIRRKKDNFMDLPRNSALKRAMRESYFSHIYHTVAIEGNTLTLGETRSILESGMPVPGKSLREHNEVLGMDSALRFLNRSLIHLADITLEDVLEMHRRVLGHAQPIDAGRLRDTQVYVGRFTPVAPKYVKEQMLELIDWLNDPSTNAIDPVQRAAIAHYKLVVVHPFIDGNGRTARLLLNLVLMKAGFPPVILPVSTRAEYYATLNTANLGDLRPFVRYVAHHVDRTLQTYINLVSTCADEKCSVPDEILDEESPLIKSLHQSV
ncbi:unnamed protein product, partial [Mesorhabditis belari]|uniref:protein adenylyltransferase n=1 Tax=Mesorhabditis belari TaxID=2138241 RepID=A0AAF3J9X9_9BILA